MKAVIEAIKLFNIEGAIDSIAPFGLGHINDSFVAKTGATQYLVQRLNTNAFQEPSLVEENLQRLFSKSPDLFPFHLKGANNQYHQTTAQGVWRIQELVENSYSPDLLTTQEIAEVAKGFGRFTNQFSSESSDNYQESIPKFHNLWYRLSQLDEAISNDSARRKSSVENEIVALNEFRWIAGYLNKLLKDGLPERVCHNDAKAANCLLQVNTSEFLKIVDLDTVGPGYVLYDFGDLMRSMLFNIPENQKDLADLVFDQSRYETILNSFLKECKNSLTTIEVKSLAFGGLYMTYIMTVRFLTDYLNGDVYYKISFTEENLVRTRNQLKILELMDRGLNIQLKP